uniref:Uncharacterized protein n=1 Tax=Zea mays TaxID=4577 RepID=A0A804PGP0_MAIZE
MELAASLCLSSSTFTLLLMVGQPRRCCYLVVASWPDLVIASALLPCSSPIVALSAPASLFPGWWPPYLRSPVLEPCRRPPCLRPPHHTQLLACVQLLFAASCAVQQRAPYRARGRGQSYHSC